jgi:hypothetical protein
MIDVVGVNYEGTTTTVFSVWFGIVIQLIFILYSIYKCSYEIERTEEEIQQQQQNQKLQRIRYQSLLSSSQHQRMSFRHTRKSYLFDDQSSAEHVKRELLQLVTCHSNE